MSATRTACSRRPSRPTASTSPGSAAVPEFERGVVDDAAVVFAPAFDAAGDEVRVDGPRDRDDNSARVGLRVEDPLEACVGTPLADVRAEAEVAPGADEDVQPVGELRVAGDREAHGDTRELRD